MIVSKVAKVNCLSTAEHNFQYHAQSTASHRITWRLKYGITVRNLPV
jgi:hypothetical protein